MKFPPVIRVVIALIKAEAVGEKEEENSTAQGGEWSSGGVALAIKRERRVPFELRKLQQRKQLQVT